MSLTDYVDENGVTRLRATPKGGGAQPFLRVIVPISFDTPNLTAPGPGIAAYTPTEGDIFLGCYVSVPVTAWDGATPDINIGIGPLGDLGHYAAGGLKGVNGPTGSGDTTIPLVGAGGGDIFQYSEILHADPVMALIDDGSGGDPGSTQGAGEIVMFIVPAAT